MWVWAATTLWPCMTADLELHVRGGLCLFVEEVEGVVVVLHHDVHVFLVEVRAGEAVELVVLGLVVGVQAGGGGESPGLGEGLHALGEGGVLDDHLVGEGFDLRVGGLGLGELAELDLVEATLRGLGEELLVLVGDGCACADSEIASPAQPSVAMQTNFAILFMEVPLQVRQCRELRTVRVVRGGLRGLALHTGRHLCWGLEFL